MCCWNCGKVIDGDTSEWYGGMCEDCYYEYETDKDAGDLEYWEEVMGSEC